MEKVVEGLEFGMKGELVFGDFQRKVLDYSLCVGRKCKIFFSSAFVSP